MFERPRRRLFHRDNRKQRNSVSFCTTESQADLFCNDDSASTCGPNKGISFSTSACRFRYSQNMNDAFSASLEHYIVALLTSNPNINVVLPALFSMSYHRVLPRPLPLSNEELADRWAVGKDSLESARIMTNERSNTAYAKNGQITASTASDSISKGSPPPSVDQQKSPPAKEEQGSETEPHNSASARTRKPAPSSIDTWEGDIPSQICLCQPDPKVPRPRNGM